MVGCDHIAEDGEHLGVFEIADLCPAFWTCLGSRADFAHRLRPAANHRFRLSMSLRLPFLVALEDGSVFFLKGGAGHCLFDQLGDFFGAWPEVF